MSILSELINVASADVKLLLIIHFVLCNSLLVFSFYVYGNSVSLTNGYS